MSDFPSSPESTSLKPCPFCKAEAAVFMQEIVNGRDQIVAAHVLCDACEAQGPECRTVSEASAMWNDRGGVAQTPAVPVDAIVNLTNHQQQCDMDGVMVQVSRQSLCEVLLYVTEVRPDNKWAVSDSSTDQQVDEIAARSPGVPKATIRKLLEADSSPHNHPERKD